MNRFEQRLQCIPLRSPEPVAGEELLSRAHGQLRSQRRCRLASATLVTAASMLLMVNIIVGSIQAQQIADLSSLAEQPPPLQTRPAFIDHIEARTRFITRNLSTGDTEAGDLPEVAPTPVQRPAQMRGPASLPPVTAEQLRARHELIEQLLGRSGERLYGDPPTGSPRSNGGLHQLHRCGLSNSRDQARFPLDGVKLATGAAM